MQMTGKDLIVYILRHDLENEVIFDNGIFSKLFYTCEEVAVNFGVGTSTVRGWHMLGMIQGYDMNGCLYFPRSIEDPRSKINQGADCNG